VTIAFGMVIVNLATLILLVPRFGYLGAGAATLATAASGLTHAVIVSRRIYAMPFPSKELGKIILAVLAMALALSDTTQYRGVAALVTQIGIGGLTYGATALALNLLNLREAGWALLARRIAWR
jgi:O-antigen/teichoic acid export membrane protein